VVARALQGRPQSFSQTGRGFDGAKAESIARRAARRDRDGDSGHFKPHAGAASIAAAAAGGAGQRGSSTARAARSSYKIVSRRRQQQQQQTSSANAKKRSSAPKAMSSSRLPQWDDGLPSIDVESPMGCWVKK
jgi:hypothetical protein